VFKNLYTLRLYLRIRTSSDKKRKKKKEEEEEEEKTLWFMWSEHLFYLKEKFKL
jgi:hypothetical protein